jgi:hypothetical protein
VFNKQRFETSSFVTDGETSEFEEIRSFNGTMLLIRKPRKRYSEGC